MLMPLPVALSPHLWSGWKYHPIKLGSNITWFKLLALPGKIRYSIGFLVPCLCIFLFGLCCMACRILVPQPGIQPGPLAGKAQVLTTGWLATSVSLWDTCHQPTFVFPESGVGQGLPVHTPGIGGENMCLMCDKWRTNRDRSKGQKEIEKFHWAGAQLMVPKKVNTWYPKATT